MPNLGECPSLFDDAHVRSITTWEMRGIVLVDALSTLKSDIHRLAIFRGSWGLNETWGGLVW